MTWIFLIMAVVIVILLAIIIRIKRELKLISKQIDTNKEVYFTVRISILDKDIDNLATKINYLYDEKQKIYIENKKAQDELKQSITSMTHDLRTPLTSIMGYLQLLKNENVSYKEKEEYISIIEKRTKNLQNLISSFYDISRIQSKEYKFYYEKVNISVLLCENIALFYNDFVNKGIEPIIDIDEDIQDIITDKNAVIRIFSNLINNILKHGDDYVKISLKNENNYIISEFINKAPNVGEEDIPKLFNRCYTVDKSRNDNNTGIGLYITKILIEQLGNTIEGILIDGNLVIKIKWLVNSNERL